MEIVAFNYLDYKKFVHEWIQSKPNKGRGQLSRIAKFLNTSTVSVSHIFKGPRNLSMEQAVELTEFLGLSELESEYFLSLVDLERAGSHKLKNRIRKKLSEISAKAKNLKSRLTQDMEIDESAKSIFYSNWYFSGVRLASSIKGIHSIDALSELLELPRMKVREIVDFLLKYGLVVEKSGEYHMGPKVTHLGADSLLVSRHHSNWRLKGMRNMESLSEEELFYTGPMTLSLETMKEVRKDLVDLIDRVLKKIEPSPAEALSCLNIDWYRIRPRDFE